VLGVGIAAGTLAGIAEIANLGLFVGRGEAEIVCRMIALGVEITLACVLSMLGAAVTFEFIDRKFGRKWPKGEQS